MADPQIRLQKKRKQTIMNCIGQKCSDNVAPVRMLIKPFPLLVLLYVRPSPFLSIGDR